MANRTMRRAGYGLLIGAGLLLVAFAALVAYQLYAGRDRLVTDQGLLAELEGAEFVEEGPPPADAGWPQWRGPRRDGVAAAFELPNPLPKTPAWKVPAGRGYSSFAVAGDAVYTMLRDGEREAVVRLRTEDGQGVWAEAWRTAELKERAGYSSPVAATVGGVRQVVVFTGAGVAGLAADSGRLLWRFPWPTANQVNAATPIVFKTRRAGKENDYVFISSGYAKGCALLKIEPDGSGGFRARRVFEGSQLKSHFRSPVRAADHVSRL